MNENTKFDASGLVDILSEGADLERGGIVERGEAGIRLACGAELVDTRDRMAMLGRLLHDSFTTDTTPPISEPQILLVGNIRDGFEAYGPFAESDPDERAEARMRSLENSGEDYIQMDLHPLTNLTPVDPDPEPAVAVGKVSKDVEIEGVGTLKADDTYIQLVTGKGTRSNCYALVGQEIMEAYDLGPTGEPDWATASMCDLRGGDETFLYPAHIMLRYLNPDAGNGSYWHFAERRDVEARLQAVTEARLIRAWTSDRDSGGYKVVPNGRGDDRKLWTPTEAAAFLDGIEMAGAHILGGAK